MRSGPGRLGVWAIVVACVMGGACWGKCREPRLRHDEACAGCYRGAASCPAVVQGEPIPGRLRFEAPLTAFARTFELRHGNPNHPDRSFAFVGRDPESRRLVVRAEARTVYEVDRVVLLLDLETGTIERTSQASGHALGTTRIAYPPRGDAADYRAELLRLREVVARVQAGYWLPELGFEQPAVPELIGALCYLDALAASLP